MDKSLKKTIKQIDSLEVFLHTLKEVERRDLSGTDVHLLDKTLKKLKATPHLKIAYLSSYTIDPLPPYVNAIAALEGVILQEYVGGYNQYFQEILDPESELIAFNPHIIYLALSTRDLFPKERQIFSSFSVEEVKTNFNRIILDISDWIKAALNNTKATIIVSNFVSPSYCSAGLADINKDYGESEFYLELNLELLRLFKKESRVHLFDMERLASQFGKDQVYDSKMYYLAKIPWQEKFFPVIASELIRYIRASQSLAKKCLVLDLDNTLWGGVVGEEGYVGIKIGHGDPIGEAFLDFQYKIKAIQSRGIILAICSKNNREDALEVFEKRSEMALKISDFSVTEINWNDKPTNLKKIAEKLNIGTDSLVFIDDNPVECSLVKQVLPEVETLCLPPDPANYTRIIDRIKSFDRLQILEDDLKKTTQYLQNKEREYAKIQIGDLAAYLKDLATEITIRQATQEDIPRVFQLFNKTNQFNVTTIRYSLGEVEHFVNDSSKHLNVVSARDKFGELGIIGLYLVQLDSPIYYLDSFIMSCRAMGRGIETAIMNYIKQQYLIGQADSLSIRASYSPTRKNKPVEFFFEEQGFELLSKERGGRKEYILESIKTKILDCYWIKIVS